MNNKVQIKTTLGDLIYSISEIVREFPLENEEEANFITHHVLMDLLGIEQETIH